MRLFTLFCLTLYCVMAGAPAAAESGIYVSLGSATSFPEDTLFVDGGKPDSDLPKLYGRPGIYTDSRLDASVQMHVGVGYRFTPWLRSQVEFNMTNGLDYHGNTNYLRAGEYQPATAELDMRQFLFSGFYDFPALRLGGGLRVQPYMGAGAGVSDYDVKDFVQKFPALHQGADGGVALTRLPDGDGQEFVYMLSAGIVIPITRRASLDLGYRYTDLGEIKTDIGDIIIERYRQDGSRRPDLAIKIDETVADLKTHALLGSFRLQF